MRRTWTSTSLGSLLDDHFSGAWGTDPVAGRRVTTVLRATDIDSEGHVDLSKGVRRSLPERERLSKVLRGGDILLEASGGGPGKPVGRPAWFPGRDDTEYATSNFFKTLRPNQKVHSRFLLWKLLHLSTRPEIWQYQQQTTGIINLKFQDYLSQYLDVPPLGEQRRLAEILDTLDDQIRATEQLITKLMVIKNGAVSNLFLNGLDGCGSVSDWRRQRVGDLFDMTLGKMLDSGKPQRGVVRPYLTNRNVKWEFIDLSDLECMVFSNADRLRYALKDGDILMCEGGEIGRCAVWEYGSREIYFQKAIHRLRARGEVDPIFFVDLFQWTIQSGVLAGLIGQTSIAHLPAEKLGPIELPIPPVDVQRNITRKVNVLRGRLEKESNQLRKLRMFKQGLMADLLTGRVRVPVEAGA